MSDTKPVIGFVGLGLMGHGMAKNIVEKGYPLTVTAHRNRAPVDDLAFSLLAVAGADRLMGEGGFLEFDADTLRAVLEAGGQLEGLAGRVDAPDDPAQIKERVRAFRKEVIALAAEETSGAQVVQLNIQLFPLSDSAKGHTP